MSRLALEGHHGNHRWWTAGQMSCPLDGEVSQVVVPAQVHTVVPLSARPDTSVNTHLGSSKHASSTKIWPISEISKVWFHIYNFGIVCP